MSKQELTESISALNQEGPTDTIPALKAEDRLALISRITVDYQIMGYPRSVENYAENFSHPVETMRQYLFEVKESLEKAGCHLEPTVWMSEEQLESYEKTRQIVLDPNDPDPMFILVAQSVLDLSDSRSLGAKIKEFAPVGVTSKSWTKWMEKPANLKFFNEVLEKRFDKDVERNAQLAVARNVSAGDMTTIKWYYEMTNKYRPANQNTENLSVLLGLVMQILVKHLDPEVIDVVADELETLPLTSQGHPLQLITGTGL